MLFKLIYVTPCSSLSYECALDVVFPRQVHISSLNPMLLSFKIPALPQVVPSPRRKGEYQLGIASSEQRAASSEQQSL